MRNTRDSTPDFVLASASPRRVELLQQIGASFLQLPVDIDEQALPGEQADRYVERMAREKAVAGWEKQSAHHSDILPSMGADTCVVLGQKILGKPNSEQHAIEMLLSLSGRTHRVLTAVAICRGEHCKSLLSETKVTFRRINPQQCRWYWQTGEPTDKAGGYGIQGLAGVFVERIEGSYSGVVGLPLVETHRLLKAFDIPWGATGMDKNEH